MLLAELEQQAPELIPVLWRRAAGWCLANGLPEEALEYCMAAGDAEGAARLVGQLVVPAYRKGRVTTIQRWLGWLEEQGGIGGHPMIAVLASLVAALMGRPVEAERWADAVDRLAVREPGPRTRPPRHGPSWPAPPCASAGPGRCAPTPTQGSRWKLPDTATRGADAMSFIPSGG
jgi:ATP/maltotriose-dependent transcriptional regulator MalT